MGLPVSVKPPGLPDPVQLGQYLRDFWLDQSPLFRTPRPVEDGPEHPRNAQLGVLRGLVREGGHGGESLPRARGGVKDRVNPRDVAHDWQSGRTFPLRQCRRRGLHQPREEIGTRQLRRPGRFRKRVGTHAILELTVPSAELWKLLPHLPKPPVIVVRIGNHALEERLLHLGVLANPYRWAYSAKNSHPHSVPFSHVWKACSSSGAKRVSVKGGASCRPCGAAGTTLRSCIRDSDGHPPRLYQE